jgi:hypothetical protein
MTVRESWRAASARYRAAHREKVLAINRAYAAAHSEERSGAWVSWYGMKSRCSNPKQYSFKDYGGRGITVCERWKVYANFLADMGPRPPGTTLDRIDNDKGYEKSNCRWATPKEQAQNRRRRAA